MLESFTCMHEAFAVAPAWSGGSTTTRPMFGQRQRRRRRRADDVSAQSSDAPNRFHRQDDPADGPAAATSTYASSKRHRSRSTGSSSTRYSPTVKLLRRLALSIRSTADLPIHNPPTIPQEQGALVCGIGGHVHRILLRFILRCHCLPWFAC